MRKDNIFMVGTEADKDGFIGRRQIVEEISNKIHRPRNCLGVAVIGLNHVGKTSLLNEVIFWEYKNESNVLIVKIRMNDIYQENGFWWEVTTKLQQEVEKKQINDPILKRSFTAILHQNDIMFESPEWYSRCFKNEFEKILDRLNELSIRLVLYLDQFDSAREIFDSASVGLIRNMSTSSSWSITVLVTSKRNLSYIEKCIRDSDSTLAGAFNQTFYLKAFEQVSDMDDYWNSLVDYDIFPDQAFKEKLIELTGRQPYLLSVYGYNLAESAMAGEKISVELLEKINQSEKTTKIHPQYKRWLDQIKESGYLEKLRELVCGPRITVSQSDVDDLKTMGFVERIDENQAYFADFPGGYCVISYDFTQYFLEQTKDIKVDEWTAITEAEKVLRMMLSMEYPEIETIGYNMQVESNVAALKEKYPELEGLNKGVYWKRLEKNKDLKLINTLDFSFSAKIISEHWKKFQKYFCNADLSKWKHKFDLLIEVRNIYAHSNEKFLKDDQRRDALNYCQDIIKLTPNNDILP